VLTENQWLKSQCHLLRIDRRLAALINSAFSGRRPALMNRSWPFFTAILVAFFGIAGWAGTITYVGIPSIQSDFNCGISRSHGYTSAVDGGNTRGTDRVLNGITLFSLTGSGQNTATADNCTMNALSGTLTDAGLTSKNIAADGTVRDFLSDMVFNNAGGDNSQVEIVLDPESLEHGSTYDLRVYICSSSGQNRQVNLAFFGDGQNGVETGFFNEDDARSSAGGFSAANQVYYINYRYTWDGDSTPGITISQKFGGAPFCLYALTNELVKSDKAEAGAAAERTGTEHGEQGLTSSFVDQESDHIGVQSDDFYGSESLNSYGRWIKLSKWGACWQPTDMPSGWSPYSNGSWKQSDNYGWTFVSDEPWAWACYHYGRWAKVNAGCGWAWVPGTVWAPSWVSWRQGKSDSCSCIGWAPLPPEARCQIGVGISSWVDTVYNIGPECYTFINVRDFGSDSYSGCGCIYERFRNSTIIVDTFNCTNIYYERRVNIYCAGPDYDWCNSRIRQLGGKEPGKIYINRYDNPDRLGGKWAQYNDNQLALVSPRIRGTKHPHNRPTIAESVGAAKIEHGWKGIRDKEQEQQVRDYVVEETKGKNPRNSPAKLPEAVAERMNQKHNAQNVGPAGTAGDAEGDGVDQGQTGGDQHLRKGRHKGQGQLAGGTRADGGAGAAPATNAGAAGSDQHPGKNRGGLQAGNAGTDQQQQFDRANNQQSGHAQSGAGRGRLRPGQSLNKQKAAPGGDSVTQESSLGPENGVTGGESGERSGRRRGKRLSTRRSQIQAVGQGGAGATSRRTEAGNQQQQQHSGAPGRGQITPPPR
jgi:hypothetical protein